MFANIINLIKIGLKYKKKYIKLKLNKNKKTLIKILIKLNFIKFIKLEKKNTYVVFFNNSNVFKNIKNLYKPSSKLSISFRELKKLSFKKKWIIILSTNKGVITNFESIKKKTSGILIATIFY